MTTDELRAAAERVLATITKTTDESTTTVGRDGGRVSGCVQYARSPDTRMGLQEPYELAAAWLAEHPADDDEPVTLGVVAEDGLRRVEVMVAGAGRVGAYLIDRRHFSDPVWLRDVTTSGDVRRLLAALGITHSPPKG